ncbi:hypothetical protein GFC01_10720 [Desulfofundulus thermobenzoicus]|uniref:Uncharacterized protein n=1 Tax=Desulfofundulus thermobenzoicus TaxID=29376 RepID=A0A6N7IRK6_9FIRM|nr:hypothetical protein [Desulfofundulus thermobenzoicus]MQL52726.1 hypothetical protein [Desulfofundulus thermobenzoicus]
MDLKIIEDFKNLILDHGLPETDVVLFGVICPYCGKHDRIRQLEAPQELAGALDENVLHRYRAMWNLLSREDQGMAVCKFCHNIMAFADDSFRVETLY